MVLTSCGGGSAKPPAPAADFALTVIPTSVSLTPGAAGQAVSITATASNGFTSTVAVAITGLPTGVTAQPTTLSLMPGAAQSITLTAAANTAAASNVTVTFTGTSGTLTHTATVAVTVLAPTPPADFSLALSPTSLTLTAGAAGSPVSVTATAANGFTGMVAVALSGLPAGVTASPATLTLSPGAAQSTTLTADASASTGTATVTFTGTSGSLTHTTTLALTVQAAPPPAVPDVTTFHYDNARDGLNSQETVLTPANVNSSSFGRIGYDTVDGKVDAQPLYLANITVGGQSRNVLYIATEHDSVYAFDADSNDKQLWQVSVLGNNETTSDNHGCGQITPEIGITSTPVIDRKQGTNGTIFVVGMTKDGSGNYHQRIHALDLTTGMELSGSPVEISASYPGSGPNSQNGSVTFDPGQYAERAALLLVNGNIYLGWTSHCDIPPYNGWIMAYDEKSLKQTQVLNLTPDGTEGSIWMSGDGMAADSSGNIFLLDANGTFDTNLDANGFPDNHDFGNAMLRLTISGGKLGVGDYFEQYDTVAASNNDLDLGSGGEILLPDQTDANGKARHLIVGAGKDKNIYLADRDNMGKFNSGGTSNSNLYQEISGQLTGKVYSTPAYFNGVLYYSSVDDHLKAFPFTNAQMASKPSSQSSAMFAMPGTTPSISSNGTSNGIVWALESNVSNPNVLHAYDPADLTHEYYNSNQAPNGRDSFNSGNKFIAPVIVNGKVYIGTPNGVAMFGLLSH